MTIKNNPIDTKPLAEKLHIPQYRLPMILFMFTWPAVWFTLLIYVVGKSFIPEGGTTPTWLTIAIIVLGTGAELAAGLVLLRREGYELTLSSLQGRIRWRWPKGWKAWSLASVVFILGMSLSMMMGPVNRSLAAVPGFVPPDWWPAASNPTIKVGHLGATFGVHRSVRASLFYYWASIQHFWRGDLLPRFPSSANAWGFREMGLGR